MKRSWSVLVLVAAACAGVWLLVRSGQTPPDGPVDVAWDVAVCAECRMHVSDPRFSAQLQTRDAEVAVFDDPGCLFRYRAAKKPSVHATYFHSMDGDAWLPESNVGFRQTPETPMGYGFGAVPKSTPGAVSVRDAERRVLTERRP